MKKQVTNKTTTTTKKKRVLKKVTPKKTTKATTIKAKDKEVAKENVTKKVDKEVIWNYPANCVTIAEKKKWRAQARAALNKLEKRFHQATTRKSKNEVKAELKEFFDGNAEVDGMMTATGKKKKLAELNLNIRL